MVLRFALPSELSISFFGFTFVGLGGLLWTRKVTEMFATYSSSPPAVMQGHAVKSGCSVCEFSVVTILLMRRLAEVGPSIIERVVVDVIDFILRPRSRHYKPRDSMQLVSPLFNFDFDTTDATPLFPHRTGLAPKLAGFGVVSEVFADILCG